MKRNHLRWAAMLAAGALAGCASVDIDRSIDDTNRSLRGFTQSGVELARNDEQQARRKALAEQLLAQPLTQDDAVQLALTHSPEVQALLAQSWNDMAQAARQGRIGNPVFSFERVRSADELEIGRLLSFGLLDLLTLPLRQGIARHQIAQAELRLAAQVVDRVSQVRQAWVRAVAAKQSLAYAQQVDRSAQASAELARRMQQAGNFNRLQRARQQAFYADAAAQLAMASHRAVATREALVRQLGLSDRDADRLRLPERLPDLPQAPRTVHALGDAAMAQRLDVKLARIQLEQAGRAQGLDLLNALVDVELGLRRDTHFAPGERATARGFEIDIRLPIFDWGQAQRAAMNAQSIAAAQGYEATTRRAGSQLREAYAGYRSTHALARHLQGEVVPLRKTISEENLLRYNGMLIGVFELLADHREQIAAVVAAIDAQQQFWLADAALSASLIGQPVAGADLGMPMTTAPTAASAGH